MPFDAFLKITISPNNFIKGESTDDKHKDEIEVLSFSWGVAQQLASKGAAAGKADIHDFSIVKNYDAASPRLFVAACTGQFLQSALFTVRRAGENPIDFLKVTLSDVLVSSVTPGGSAAGAPSVPLETVSFNFGKIDIHYTPQNEKGSGGAAVTGSCTAH
jgi:type VI secretion system secreted protein Hcp